jgi:hypothetical protein
VALLYPARNFCNPTIESFLANPELTEPPGAVNAGGANEPRPTGFIQLPHPLKAIERLNRASLAAFSGQQLEVELSRSGLPGATGETTSGGFESQYLEQAWLKTGHPLAAVCTGAA